MVTFLTVLLRARGAAGPGDPPLLEADLSEIGWLCNTTFFRGGEFLQKRTTGVGGKNSKGEPSSCVGSGPSCCCRKTEQDFEGHLQKLLQKVCEGEYLFCRDVIFSIELLQQCPQRSPEGMSFPHGPPNLKTICG